MQLHKLLQEVAGANNVYFQPPSNIKMKYPCIRYKLTGDYREHADNQTYLFRDRYTVMVIDTKADSALREAVRKLPLCSFRDAYTAENLHHFVFELYY